MQSQHTSDLKQAAAAGQEAKQAHEFEQQAIKQSQTPVLAALLANARKVLASMQSERPAALNQTVTAMQQAQAENVSEQQAVKQVAKAREAAQTPQAKEASAEQQEQKL